MENNFMDEDIEDAIDLIEVIEDHEEPDGSVVLTIKAPQFIIDMWEAKYGPDFGEPLFRDAIAYAETLSPEDVADFLERHNNKHKK